MKTATSPIPYIAAPHQAAHLAGLVAGEKALIVAAYLLALSGCDITKLGGKDWRDLTTHAKCAECGHVQSMNAQRATWRDVKDDCEECRARAVRPYKRI